MTRFKQIMKYVFIMIVFIIFTNIAVEIGINNTYRKMPGKIYNNSITEITVSEAKRTDNNGYVSGVIKNISDNDLNRVFIKLDLYSKNDVLMGTEYFEITDLKNGESKEFDVKFNYNRIDNYELRCVNEIGE